MDKMIPFYNTENIPGQKYAEILVYGTAVKFV